MDGISQSLMKGSKVALNLVKSLLQTPTLINPGFGLYPNQSPVPFVIPLETEHHTQSMSAEVSQSLVIAKTNKENVSDNIAPGPWTWSLSGYIPGITALEPSNYFTPFVTLNTNLLKLCMKKGYILVFKDIDAAIYTKVVIKSLDIETQKDCRNKTPFRMTLQEINVMNDLSADLADAALFASIAAGTALGAAATAGATVATAVDNSELED